MDSAAPSSCPACGGPLGGRRTVPGGEPSAGGSYVLARCAACGTYVTCAAPAPGAYETGVYAPAARRPAPVRLFQRATVGQPARALERAGLPAGARVLDAGAGRGRLVEELRRRGHHARGIDASARQTAGGLVERASIAGHEDSALDAVVLWHALEHLDDPADALRRVSAWLAPGGLLLVGAPNAASWQARLAGPAWMHWDAPRHRQHFTPRGLSALLGRTGFEVVRTEHLVWEHNPASMWMALLSRLAGVSPAYAFHALKGNAPRRGRDLALTLAGTALLPAAVALEAGATAARRGGTIAVVARRQSAA